MQSFHDLWHYAPSVPGYVYIMQKDASNVRCESFNLIVCVAIDLRLCNALKTIATVNQRNHRKVNPKSQKLQSLFDYRWLVMSVHSFAKALQQPFYQTWPYVRNSLIIIIISCRSNCVNLIRTMVSKQYIIVLSQQCHYVIHQ